MAGWMDAVRQLPRDARRGALVAAGLGQPEAQRKDDEAQDEDGRDGGYRRDQHVMFPSGRARYPGQEYYS